MLLLAQHLLGNGRGGGFSRHYERAGKSQKGARYERPFHQAEDTTEYKKWDLFEERKAKWNGETERAAAGTARGLNRW
jgi:hypothetical protein